ncbi:SSI family serine proteinase inhibitor [Streptomyces indiaensis]|uniref:SSI family serine proteinase inhibitor n=1 Tax=Streptomyces indiaensis TaxID=284033 RepID=A0ABP5RB75_9ACTN|nr:SSI family serine proteinase inhibitor [Streptomyces indiaensis]MCF1650329.1 subtilase-type protease inhibitor [Streptomyces indiaensis]
MLRATSRATARPALRRLLLGAAASVAVAGSLTAAPPAAYAQADATGLPSPAARPGNGPDRDHLTVTVRNAGGGADGTFKLYCDPDGGSHPDPGGACAALERDTRSGTDVFAPAPEDGFCTMQYGGPATAHVTGTWAGRPVNAKYDRRDGCQISRWDRLVPLLPDMKATGKG